MKLKQSLLLLVSISMVLLSSNSFAGRQGINLIYGIGLGAVSPADSDVAAAGSVFFGFIEDGWSLEGTAIKSTEAGTDIPLFDYSIKATDIGIAYRTVESNNSYFKFKISETDIDVTSINTATNADITTETEGRTYTLGMGWRMSRENRLEVDYSYHSSDDFSDPIHMINVSYLWGGAPYLGKDF